LHGLYKIIRPQGAERQFSAGVRRSEFVAVCSCEKTLLPSTGCPRDHCNWRHPIAHNVSLLRPRCPDFIFRIGPTINVSRSLARSHDRKVGASGHHRREEHDARHRVGVGAGSSIYANPGSVPRAGISHNCPCAMTWRRHSACRGALWAGHSCRRFGYDTLSRPGKRVEMSLDTAGRVPAPHRLAECEKVGLSSPPGGSVCCSAS
jgi:hypothetical protein